MVSVVDVHFDTHASSIVCWSNPCIGEEGVLIAKGNLGDTYRIKELGSSARRSIKDVLHQLASSPFLLSRFGSGTSSRQNICSVSSNSLCQQDIQPIRTFCRVRSDVVADVL